VSALSKGPRLNYILNLGSDLQEDTTYFNYKYKPIYSDKSKTQMYSYDTTKERVEQHTRVGTLIVATIYLQLIQNRYMFRSFTVRQCSHQHCVQPVASDVEVVGYL